MVGSGDGNVSLIRDSTVTAKGNKQNRHKSVNSGVSTTVKEPTEPCLTEVWTKNTHMLALIRSVTDSIIKRKQTIFMTLNSCFRFDQVNLVELLPHLLG